PPPPRALDTDTAQLAFRQTVHEYGVDLSWTPMILCKEFNRSQIARDSGITSPLSPPSPY
ncbi:hypothetical protein IMZ48_28125, partial [Candidatus Bathyarchaeota archaeon]|nr:hypothetical protein [Candidatus Bathyarchaeota archaeon]